MSSEKPRHSIQWLNTKPWYRFLKVLFILMATFIAILIILFTLISATQSYNQNPYNYQKSYISCNYGNKKTYTFNELGINIYNITTTDPKDKLDFIKLCEISHKDNLPKIYTCDPHIKYEPDQSIPAECRNPDGTVTDPAAAALLGLDEYFNNHYNDNGSLKFTTDNTNFENKNSNLLFRINVSMNSYYSALQNESGLLIIALIIELIILEIIRRISYYIFLGKFYPPIK